MPWEQHILEVLTGVRTGEQDRRPQFDPQQRSLAEREAAKAAELAAAGGNPGGGPALA